MLNIFPKFELVPIKRYFFTLADARRPSMIPLCRICSPGFSRMMSAASRATSTAEDTEMPTSAACSDGRVVDSVAHIAHYMTALLEFIRFQARRALMRPR
jgi:hypothetical protein